MPIGNSDKTIHHSNARKSIPAAVPTVLASRDGPQQRQSLSALAAQANAQQSSAQSTDEARPPSRAGRAEIASKIRVDVKDTLTPKQPQRPATLKHQTSQTTDDDLSEQRFGSIVRPEPEQRRPIRHGPAADGHFHDDNSVLFGTDDGSVDDQENRTIFRVDQRRVQDVLGRNWQSEAAWGREIHQARHANGDTAQRPAVDFSDDTNVTDLGWGDNFSDEEDGGIQASVDALKAGTPSKQGPVPPAKSLPAKNNNASGRNVKFAEQDPRLFVEQQQQQQQEQEQEAVKRFSHSAERTLDRQARYARVNENLARTTFTEPQETTIPQEPVATRVPLASKVSVEHEPSEDERQMPQGQPVSAPLQKRPHALVDYDPEQLEKMNYFDLDKVPFHEDPRVPPSEPATDLNGNPVSLTQKLSNLSKISPAEQAALFRSLTDEEDEQVGQWFIRKFQEDLKKLMEKRVERRKVALRYETEVRKRQAKVEWKTQGVEGELSDLRKGGEELVRDRKGSGTPKAKP